MGTFMGHVVPGTFFTLFPLWWMYSIFRRYFISKKFHHNGTEGYRSSVSFPCTMCRGRLPIEGFTKIISVIIGIIGETATAFKNGQWAHIGNAQHITMFSFFGFSGVLDVLYHWNVMALPPDLDYAVAFLAFSAEGFLFFNHLHGRTPMDIQIHMMLFCDIVACALSVIIELQNKKNVLAALARSYFTLLQGTWFFQVGFILYPPFTDAKKWEETSHEQMMITTLMFTWHAAVHILIVLLMAYLVWNQVEKMDRCPEGELLVHEYDTAPRYLNLSDQTWLRTYADDDEDEVIVMPKLKSNEENKPESMQREIEV